MWPAFSLREASIERALSDALAVSERREREQHESLPAEVSRALSELEGRYVALSSRPERLRAHVVAVALALRALRGALTVRVLGGPSLERALNDAGLTVVEATAADLFVTDRALELRPAERDAAARSPYAIVSDEDPLRDSLSSLHALVSLARPEVVSTRRSFFARFGRGDVSGRSLDDAALGATLGAATLVLDHEPPSPDDPAWLSTVRAWLDAAPRG